MEELKGYVEKIIYTNEENGHTILEVELSNDEVKRLKDNCEEYADEIYNSMVCVGILNLVHTGSYVVFKGDFSLHPSYGVQFKAVSFEETEAEDEVSIERYLASGAIKGIGAGLAARIVKKFKMDTFRIMEEEPERLSEVKGISDRIAMEIADQVVEKRDMRKAMIYLSGVGIGMNLAVKIYKTYGNDMYKILKENPYKIADDIDGVGFKIADDIAKDLGMEPDSPYRIKSGILYTLSQAVAAGHAYLPLNLLMERTKNILQAEIEEDEDLIMDLIIAKKIVVKKVNDESVVYPSSMYNTEVSVAAALTDLNRKYPVDEKTIEKILSSIEYREKIELDDYQREAVKEAAESGLLIITGGPGTGKTTTINTIIKYFEEKGSEILLAAPTGRAAKRMTEATGHEAKTIHRLLELSGMPSDESTGVNFDRNEDNPLEADVVIIDEMSMVDIFLMNSLLKAVVKPTRLILVGDVDQLPSVGPGSVLKDIIRSEKFHVVTLTKIFRQAGESDIIMNAHKINAGEPVELNKKSRDFFFVKCDEADTIIGGIIALIQRKLPQYVQAHPNEIQVMTPTRKGLLGVERMNVILQKYLNPADEKKTEREINGRLFREGDKVMQIKNNYQLEWEICTRFGLTVDKGMGVFNGDMGVISEINEYKETVEVEYDEGRKVKYGFDMVDELELAYAITVHKSQGSEYPAVILPLLPGPKLLYNRNLLYTAVTRAKKCLTIIGSDTTFQEMIRNKSEQERYTSLAERIGEF